MAEKMKSTDAAVVVAKRRWNCFCGDDGESGIRGGKADALEDGGCELNRGERFKSISILLSLSSSAS
jgi:hypothetical protein